MIAKFAYTYTSTFTLFLYVCMYICTYTWITQICYFENLPAVVGFEKHSGSISLPMQMYSHTYIHTWYVQMCAHIVDKHHLYQGRLLFCCCIPQQLHKDVNNMFEWIILHKISYKFTFQFLLMHFKTDWLRLFDEANTFNTDHYNFKKSFSFISSFGDCIDMHK